MTCPSCLTKIEKAVENVDGTDQIKVCDGFKQDQHR